MELASPSAPRRYSEAARELLRTTLLDAARALLGERGWARVTMADVAARVGVSRQTLYNTFGSRDELAQALVLREQERMLAGVAGNLVMAADLRESISPMLNGGWQKTAFRTMPRSSRRTPHRKRRSCRCRSTWSMTATG